MTDPLVVLATITEVEAEGRPRRVAVERLNAAGHRGPRGRPWNLSSLNAYLHRVGLKRPVRGRPPRRA